MTIYPGNADGVVSAPPSIDEGLRALILASFSRCSVRQAGHSQNVLTMLNCLEVLGAKYRQERHTISFYTSPTSCDAFLDCSSSIKTLELLLPVCLAMGGKYRFQFNAKDYDRIELSWLRTYNIRYSVDENIIVVEGKLLDTHIKTYDKNLASGLLIALTLMNGATLASPKDGLDTKLPLTQYVLDKFGFKVSDYPVYSISKETDMPTNYTYSVCGDYRSGVNLMLPGFLSGNVGITGLLADYPQSERRIFEQLKQLNLHVQEIHGAVFAKKSRLGDIVMDAREYAQMLPLVTVLGCFSRGKCVIKNTLKLHPKERDELVQAVELLRQLGADILRITDDYIIEGKKKLFGGSVNVNENADLAWIVASAALCCETPVTISGVPKDTRLKSILQALSVLVQ